MSNRRRYEGEEELELRLLDVSEDPASDERAGRKKKISISVVMSEEVGRGETDRRENNKLH